MITLTLMAVDKGKTLIHQRWIKYSFFLRLPEPIENGSWHEGRDNQDSHGSRDKPDASLKFPFNC